MGVEQQANLPLARRLLALFIARNQRARPRFQPEPVERRALQLRLDPRAKIGGDRTNGTVQCPREPALTPVIGTAHLRTPVHTETHVSRPSMKNKKHKN